MKKYSRVCDECNKGMNQGYVINGGEAHYCSDDCLHKHYTAEEWKEMYSDEGDSYWTEWDSSNIED